MNSSSCHVCHIIPSSVLRKLALQPGVSTQQRDALLVSAEAASFARGERTVARLTGLLPTTPPSALKHRDVFDAGGKKTLPGKLLRTEGGPPVRNAPAVNEAYDSTGTTYDFYKEILGRNSVDGRGLKIESTVHSGRAPDNAFWNGSRMVFGDATVGGPFTGSFTSTIDVVAHELTHGVTQYTVPNGLDYVDQSGALNESWSDVMGSVVKQWLNKQNVNAADWLIGAGLMKPEYGVALRSMKEPGSAWKEDDQPGDMKGYVDGGDVHTNSGIPNHAFYLAASGIGGYSWEKAGRIWYRALSLLSSQASFVDAAKATVDAASALFGAGGPEAAAVTAAWTTVKVLTLPDGCPVKLSLRSVGGFTGPVGPVTRSVEVAALPHEPRAHASALLDAVRPFDLPTQFLLPSPRSWDFLYTLTVEDGGRTREVKLHLDAAPPSLRALVEWLEEQTPDQSR